MQSRLQRAFFVLLLASTAALAWTQTLTVTTPTSGDYLGSTNQLKFLVSGANAQGRVVATTTSQTNANIIFTAEGRFDPDTSRNISASLDLNFDETAPTGKYTITVDYFEKGVKLQTVTLNDITIDTRAPKFKNVVPSTNSFVNKIVKIRTVLEEVALDTWRVQVNSKDIPNNTGTGNTVNVTWDTSLIEKDGAQTITIRATDKANNTTARSINVTLDRVAPSTTILSPTSITYRPGATIPVSINVDDQYQNSVSATGVIVTMKTLDGQFIARVARSSAQNSGNTLRWLGRVRKPNSSLKQFKIIVTAVDRAGNKAADQEVTVTIGG